MVTGYLDTTLPLITGTTLIGAPISSGGSYATGVVLSFSDLNLSGAVLSGINGTNYLSGNFHNSTINTTGTYILTVTDLAGNVSSITFTTRETVFCDLVSDVSASECNALIDFYHATNGSGWTNTGGWLVNTGVCTWSGISSCSNGHVYGMLIQSNNLTGILPESFGDLVNLQNLSLNNNHLTQLPNSFGNLTGLTTIRLYNNKLTSLPANFGELNNLLTIYLDNNLLTTLPANFGNLSHLSYLSL